MYVGKEGGKFLRDILGKYISILYRQEQKNINAAMKQYDLGYSCYNFLIYLSKKEGVSQKQMCDNLSVDEALATRTMQKLEKQGYIIRKKEDMRSYSVYLTEKGWELIPVLKEALSGWWNLLTEDLDDAQVMRLIPVLKQMAGKALSEQIGKESGKRKQ